MTFYLDSFKFAGGAEVCYLNRVGSNAVQLERHIISVPSEETMPFGNLGQSIIHLYDDTGYAVGFTLHNWYVT